MKEKILIAIIFILGLIQYYLPIFVLFVLFKISIDIFLGIQTYESNYLIEQLFFAFSVLCCTNLRIFDKKTLEVLDIKLFNVKEQEHTEKVSLMELIIVHFVDRWLIEYSKNKICKEVEEYMKKYHKEINDVGE